MQLYLALTIPTVLITCWLYTATISRTRFPILHDKAIVLLIAHPDDEAMFFAPTVLGLTRPEFGNHLKILCLSSGDANKIGSVRKKEVVKSARLLGIRSDADVLVYEDPEFPDSMTTDWDSAKIAAVLGSFFNQRSTRQSSKTAPDIIRGEAPAATIDVLITFDAGGVSGHRNHISLYHGAVAWLRGLMKGKTGWENPVALYTLTSINIVRKYMSVLDAPLTIISCVLQSMQSARKRGKKELPSQIMFLSDWLYYNKAQQAMTRAHQSQMVWFRWGWIGIGRYMVVNDLRKEEIGRRANDILES